MPPRKPPASPTQPALSVKRAPRQFAERSDDRDIDRSDVHTEARSARTQEYIAAARLREAELEKQGYCF